MARTTTTTTSTRAAPVHSIWRVQHWRPCCRHSSSSSSSSSANTVGDSAQSEAQQGHVGRRLAAALQQEEEQEQLPWWPTWQAELQQLEQIVYQVLAQADTLQPGPDLLELLSAVEVRRSNLLRPAGYFADSLARTAPQQAAAARALQHAAADVTAPVYACMPLLVALLQTVHDLLQQLAEAAAAADVHTAQAASGCSGDDTWAWVCVDAGSLLVAPAAAAAAAAMSTQALHQAEQAAAAASNAAACSKSLPAPRHCNSSSSSSSRSSCIEEVPVQAATAGVDACAVSSLRAGLDALEAAINSTLPPNSRATAPASSDSSSEHSTSSCVMGTALGAVSPATGCATLRVLMLCRQLVASWLAPVAAQQGPLATPAPAPAPPPPAPPAPATMHVGGPSCGGGPPVQAQAGSNQDDTTADRVNQPTVTLPGAMPARHDQATGKPTTRQLLQHALSTLAAVSSSSVSDNAVAPLLLLTEEQAAVIEPLLQQAGLSGSRGRGNALVPSAFLPLLDQGATVPGGESADGPAAKRAATWPCIIFRRSGDDGGHGLQLQTSSVIEVHPGHNGRLLVQGLVDATEQAWEVLAGYNNEVYIQQQQQHDKVEDGLGQQQQQELREQQQPHSKTDVVIDDDFCLSQQTLDSIHIPADSPLRLLRASTDVLQLLLSHHPHAGVRQQLYLSGLLPLLHLQDQVLRSVLNLRQQLAAEQGAPEGYAQLVLSGSCLGGAAAAAEFVQQLLPFARQHAAAEWQELQQLAARQARADGRRLQASLSEEVVEPWDVAHTSLRLVKQWTELDWGRDLAPYFTLPSLISRLDQLLFSTCGLRLVPAQTAQAAAAVPLHQQHQQQQHDSMQPNSTGCSFSEWGPHVLHLLLLADPASSNLQQQPAASQQGPPQLLGHILLELVSGGFPSCTLLQLPTPQHRPAAGKQLGSSQLSGVQHCYSPGSVVLRVPVPGAAEVRVFGQKHSQPQQQPQQLQVMTDDASPLALPGPAALQALLHELGHALSYLCPSQHLQQLLQDTVTPQATQAAPAPVACTAGRSEQVTLSTQQDPAAAAAGHRCAPVVLGPYGLCLLSGPPVGLDVREVSSHLFEHWMRHPASIRALSRHERLDCPLPPHTALQVPRLMGPPGGCSSMRLHNTLLEALTDLRTHGPGPQACRHSSTTDTAASHDNQSPDSSSAASSGSAAVGQHHNATAAATTSTATTSSSDNDPMSHATAWQQRPFPRGAALLDDVEVLATAGPVGGAKAAYVAARLLSAAAWKQLGLEQDPLQTQAVGLRAGPEQAQRGSGHTQASVQTQQQSSRGTVSGGQWMAQVLLSSGAFLPAHHTVVQLLGGSADVLTPVMVECSLPVKAQPVAEGQRHQQDTAGTAAGGGRGVVDDQQAAGTTHRCIGGWRPNLYHDVFQDVELA